VITETTDGGKTWKARKIARSMEGQSEDMALAMQDPIFYDIRFINEQKGWIMGEFGQLLSTADAGQTWTPHQNTLMTPESGIVDPMDLPTFFRRLPDQRERSARGRPRRTDRAHEGCRREPGDSSR